MDEKESIKEERALLLRTGDRPGPSYLSDHLEYPSVIPVKKFTLSCIQQLKELLFCGKNNPEEPDSAKDENCGLPDDSSKKNMPELIGQLISDLENEVELGGNDKFPLCVNVYEGETIVVDKDHPLIITSEGDTPVIVTFDEIVLMQGGQIIVKAPVTFRVNKFIKK